MKNCFALLFTCFLLSVPVLGYGQTAAELETLLDTVSLDYGTAARFVLRAADVAEPASPEEAFRFAEERRWLPKNAVSGGAAELEGVSLLLMKSFDVKGGLLYSLFGNPHYAYRELVYQDVIQGRADPDMGVSGDTLLFLTSRLLSQREDNSGSSVEAGDSEARVFDPASGYEALVDAPTPEQQALVGEINSRLAAGSVSGVSTRVTSEGVTLTLSNIQFVANSAELPDSEKEKLISIVEILKNIPGSRLLVSGHTALAGTPEDRIKTSQERAGAVAAYLISSGARKPEEIFYQGYGAERPIADNGTPEGMTLNRRVEITFLENR